MSNPSITADKTPWYQWDTGLTVTVSGGAMDECHFANRKQGTAYVQAVINGVARVPDELLQVAAPIKAYGYVSDGAGGQTYVEQTFEVIARNIPADYTYTKTAQKTIRDAEAARDQAVQAAKDAKASELAADDSAVEASKSAQSAGESASAAATSASNAANSAGDAAKSASDAKTAADKAVEDASELLKTYTDNAKTSADNAAASASNAADAASAASGSASAASTSASEAATSAQEAKGAAGNAAREVLAATKANADAAAQSATDAATAKAGAEAAKAEAAASASNAAESAKAAAKSASDAVASVSETLSEAKKYTDANTSNALVATVSGKLLHVEDAWPGKPLGLTVDGAYKQDGTPSPESPVPITVIENPVLRVTGRNLLDFSSLTEGYSIETSTGEVFKTASGKWCATLSPIPIPESLESLTLSGNDTSYQTSLVFYDDDDNFVSNRSISVTPYTFKPTANVKRMRFTAYDYDYTLKNTMVALGKGATYASYSGASINITLPSEHPYLAALPDGTHDEIVIDKYGNAILTAMVGKTETADTDGVNATVGTDSLSSTGAIEDGATVYYKLATPVTYQLGKLDIPVLPEIISNVWIEANLTPECAMTYKQDVNVVIADLTAQIAALKGTNDIVHDDSTASPDDAIDVLNNRDALDVTDHTIA